MSDLEFINTGIERLACSTCPLLSADIETKLRSSPLLKILDECYDPDDHLVDIEEFNLVCSSQNPQTEHNESIANCGRKIMNNACTMYERVGVDLGEYIVARESWLEP